MDAMDVPRPRFEQFDATVADGLAGMPDPIDGLPGYLGIRHVEAGPGLLRAEIPMRDDAPFTTYEPPGQASVPSSA